MKANAETRHFTALSYSGTMKINVSQVYRKSPVIALPVADGVQLGFSKHPFFFAHLGKKKSRTKLRVYRTYQDGEALM